MPVDWCKYPSNWKTEIRPKILERENHCCKFCGVVNQSEVVRHNKNGMKLVKIILTIAHLNHDTTDNRDENLAALCQKCHLNYDLRHHLKNRKIKKV